jgi:hypothetical protein
VRTRLSCFVGKFMMARNALVDDFPLSVIDEEF